MEKPIMIEWKYYQCTWIVVDNVDVVEYVPILQDMWTFVWWFIVGFLIVIAMLLIVIYAFWKVDK